jgi:hypothetical protein
VKSRHGHEIHLPNWCPGALALEGDANLAFEHRDEYPRKVHGPKLACVSNVEDYLVHPDREAIEARDAEVAGGGSDRLTPAVRTTAGPAWALLVHEGCRRPRCRRSRSCRLGNKFAAGGPTGNRTRVQGFAVLCVTTPPSGLDAAGSGQMHVPGRPVNRCMALHRVLGDAGPPR